ncbi:hypothetical protein V6N11_012708 [Hibiscus sabdariffa]|uniref:Uncharacterized protein n=1 Tax=Hibiscus sabdariffa TaxID=183260 RepID=A0ABR2QC85_9ROSI
MKEQSSIDPDNATAHSLSIRGGATNISTRSRALASEQVTASHATPPSMRPQNFTHSMHSSFQTGIVQQTSPQSLFYLSGHGGTSGTARVGTGDDDDDDHDDDDGDDDNTNDVSVGVRNPDL